MKLAIKKTEQAVKRLSAAQDLLKKTASGVQFKGGLDRFEIFSASLAETQVWPPNWTQHEIVSCVRNSVIQTVKDSTPDWDDFVNCLQASATGLLSAGFDEYLMWTKINASPRDDFRHIIFKIGDTKITVARKPPAGFRFDEFEAPGAGRVRSDYPRGGITIWAKGRFRSSAQAGEQLFKHISEVCGLINLAEHRHRRTFRMGEAKPKVTLLTGKYHFLFRNGESTHDEGIWYNPDFREDFWNSTIFDSKKITESVAFVKQVIRDIDRSPSKDRLRSSIRLLHEGWQSHSANQRILWVWTAFEALLSRSARKTDDYETVKRRALFFAGNPDVENIALDLAINYRNRFVHENGQGGAAESAAEYLDEYLIVILEWLLQRVIRFESHARFLDMLDVPTSSPRVAAQIVDRRRAQKARSS